MASVDSPVPIANGGTAATTAAGARSALGVAASSATVLTDGSNSVDKLLVNTTVDDGINALQVNGGITCTDLIPSYATSTLVVQEKVRYAYVTTSSTVDISATFGASGNLYGVLIVLDMNGNVGIFSLAGDNYIAKLLTADTTTFGDVADETINNVYWNGSSYVVQRRDGVAATWYCMKYFGTL